MKKGIGKAKEKITKMMQEFTDLMSEGYSIAEMEFTASFDAKGNFLGIGVGGAASIKIKVVPETRKTSSRVPLGPT